MQVHIMCLIIASHTTILKISSLYISNCLSASTVVYQATQEDAN